MERKQWKYKIGGRAQGIIPSLFLFVLFGGISVYLYINKHEAFLFGAILTAISVVLILSCVFRKIFVKVLIGKTEFYYQTKPGNGKTYRYNEIIEAWESSGTNLNGTPQRFCNYKTRNGQTIKFPFFPYEAEGVDYLIKQTQKTRVEKLITDDNEQEEYVINGKIYGKTSIVITLVLLVLVLAITLPTMTHSEPADIGGIETIPFTGLIAVSGIFAALIIRYLCFKVQIGKDGVYFRSNPLNGKYYPYKDIISCEAVQKEYRHHRPKGSFHQLHYYYFYFTDKNGKTVRFQYQKPIYEHEIETLKKRIEKEKSSEKNLNGEKKIENIEKKQKNL